MPITVIAPKFGFAGGGGATGAGAGAAGWLDPQLLQNRDPNGRGARHATQGISGG
jgi:hypothetical protein